MLHFYYSIKDCSNLPKWPFLQIILDTLNAQTCIINSSTAVRTCHLKFETSTIAGISKFGPKNIKYFCFIISENNFYTFIQILAFIISIQEMTFNATMNHIYLDIYLPIQGKNRHSFWTKFGNSGYSGCFENWFHRKQKNKSYVV